MIIDIHTHPWLLNEAYKDQDDLQKQKKAVGWDLMSPHDIEMTRISMKEANVDKMVLLPLDLTTQENICVPDNETVAKLVEKAPDIFFGFASVDPFRTDALEVVKHAFTELGLMGLKLNPSKQKFYPNDDKLYPIYELCIKYNKPIIFHSGLSWEPDAPMKYSHPLEFEEIAIKYPSLKICLAHFGWPWIMETASLLIKYPNIYADTAMIYMDSPRKFMQDTFEKQLGSLWMENNFREKVMFGSNTPRFKTRRVKSGLDSLTLRSVTRNKIMGDNACKFLGIEDDIK